MLLGISYLDEVTFDKLVTIIFAVPLRRLLLQLAGLSFLWRFVGLRRCFLFSFIRSSADVGRGISELVVAPVGSDPVGGMVK